VNVLNDLSYGVCYYVSGDFLTEESQFCKDFSSETQWVIALLPYCKRENKHKREKRRHR
jgi:hypothetical protein